MALAQPTSSSTTVKRPITLFSETDAQGRITFANEDFCSITGYTQEELLGARHNIIRHPDMPARLFALLWTTITSGQTFKAIIKNRRKDGTHYWVRATIMPIVDASGVPIKYISARHLIDNEELAVELYKDQVKRLGL